MPHRAILVHQFGGPEVMTIATVPTPDPGPGEVLVRVEAAGVNPVDTYIRSGAYARLPELPFTPGWDGAGAVAAVGEGVAGLAAGDRVYFSGTVAGRGVGAYAERALCRRDQVFPLPGGLSASQGAAIGVPCATAHRALFHRAGLREGETVLVHGASGAVGLAAVQLAAASGARVVGTASTGEGREAVRQAGAVAVADHRDPDGVRARVVELSEGRGADVIVEMVANENLDRDLGLLAQGGRVVVVGNRGRVEIDARQTMARDSTILGMSLWNASEEELAAIHADLGRRFASGELTPVVGLEFPIEDAARAHEVVMRPDGGARGKVVLVIGSA